MFVATPGLVLHTTPYAETSVVAKIFTRQFGVRAFIIKGVRGHGGRVKQNMLQPLSCLDLVVYDRPGNDLNYIKEMSPRHPDSQADNPAVANALCFFMTEVLYKALREEEPMPGLFDYVEETTTHYPLPATHLPITFLLTVARHLGIEPLDNYSHREPLFDLQEGRFVSVATETTLPPALSAALHFYLPACGGNPGLQNLANGENYSLSERRTLIDALLAYYQLHLSGFHRFHSHEILHTVLK